MESSVETVHLHEGDVLCRTGCDADSIYFIIEGKLDVYSSYGRYTLQPGAIACSSDGYYGICMFTYVAAEDTVLEKYPYSKTSDLIPLCTGHSDRLGSLVTSGTDFVMQVIRTYLSLTLKCRQKDSKYSPDSRINKWELDKFNGMYSIPTGLSEQYYQSNTSVAVAAIADGARFVATLNDVCLQMADFLGINLEYVEPVRPAEAADDNDDIIISADSEYYTPEQVKSVLSNSLRQIVGYACMDEEDTSEFLGLMDRFSQCSGKMSTDDETHNLRRKLTKYFYKLYFDVFTRSLNDEFIPDTVLMFLNFGFIDERLISDAAAVTLYNLLHLAGDACNNEHVYTMYEWLKRIAWGEKEPSRNSFDQSYAEYVREQAKLGKADVADAMSDNNMKVQYEIDNMFAQVQRMAYGRVSSFVPFLIDENIQRSLDSVLLTAKTVMKHINKFRSIDFSLFYRSGFFTDEKLGIGREVIYKEFIPDIILTPCAGTCGVMWQEIDGRDRNTPGRFILPLFCNGKIESILANVLGKFRWELCKRIQGAYWNDITEKSLTSEYCDYLQFYKKNHDLSDAAKEKIKTTLTNCRNSFSEFFARDYETWITYEVSGSSRLNKVARLIMLKYCPFEKSIRNSLKDIPAYSHDIELYERRCLVEKKHLDNAISLIEKNGETVPDVLINAKEFLSR